MRPSSLLAALATSSIVLCAASSGFAADPAAAQALFDNGKRLMSQRQYPAACAAFQESQKLDPGMGTLFHLAECEERLGKTATAWVAYLEVSSEAHVKGETARETAANERAAALKPHLARIVVDPGAERATPGIELSRDGEVLGQGQWEIEVPVDAGTHTVEARAPGKGTWRTTVSVADGARTVVTVPLLADAPSGAIATMEAGDPVSTTRTTSGEESTLTRSHGNGQRIAGAVLGAAGLAGLGVGTYFGAVSLSKHDDSSAHCRGNVCDSSGVNLRNDARQDGDVATVALAAGGAVLVAGIITYLTAPHGHAQTTGSTHPVVGVGPGGLSLSGVW